MENNCGCVRPDSCGFCRTQEESERYWNHEREPEEATDEVYHETDEE